MNLELFRAAKMPEIEVLRRMQEQGSLPSPMAGTRPDFLDALKYPRDGKGFSVIAEFKQSSPSRGVINDSFTPEEVASQYAEGGADCISVLTEERYFGGDLEFLSRMASVNVPLLRKDFIFDPLQVAETAATPASAMLVIVRMLPNASLLRSLREEGEEHGIHSVVEVFDEDDLRLARESGARIIQVNARDLDTLKTDRIACLEMAAKKLPGETWIAASGMSSPQHISEAVLAGYDAVLIGTALMETGVPGKQLKTLLSECIL